MAAHSNEKGKSVSFTFSKTKPAPKLVQGNKKCGYDIEEAESDKDFLHSAEGKVLKSKNPKAAVKELVIPCRSRNDVLLARVKNEAGNTLDKQAAEEIIKDLTNAENVENKIENNFAIPLLARTHLATKGETTSDAGSSTIIEDESTLEDYDAVPVTSFGAAMLRGMGWKKGEAIGGTNKGLTVPIEFIPRSQGLGLGAERRHEDGEKKRRRKPGDTKSSEYSGAIIEKNGRVRHFKGLDEKLPEQSDQGKTFSKGGYIVIEYGAHKNLGAKITAVDEDNARLIVRLAMSDVEVTVSQHNVKLVDKDEYRQFIKGNAGISKDDKDKHKIRKRQRDVDERNTREYSSKKHKTKHKKLGKESDDSVKKPSQDNHEHETTIPVDVMDEHCWMAPLIRVRIISKSFKNGRYYQKKVVIQDVISRNSCVCKTDEGRLIDDVPQTALETVIPKIEPRYILFVQGVHQGEIGEIVQTESSKQQAVVQILSDRNIVKSHYDDICEYTAEVHQES
ncbi:G-patch domain and KOW motifs-containing protein-like [Dendronephthya gigantea]|uniref:G-patch domain and KOW motifs-containing protein-like n=1 Tax=Dendronephthya gigantea TaxID=151771 RepID=UPI00106C5D05|nr:G-patch domain and KOW motifs-containing protein-like [Dendronephthya gigantea]